jgi:lysylphosphatidylglycerol synthetase-like protein (DUF2156 family)
MATGRVERIMVGHRRGTLAALRRIPFTVSGVAVMLIIGALAGTLAKRVADHPWGQDVAYGLPAFADGRWWTLITGSFFAVTPLCYVPVIASFALLVGFAERRLGTVRAVLACVYGHLVGVLGAALLLALGSGGWSERWAHTVDVGFSAGAMAAGAIATAALAPPWRLRARLALVAYCIGAIVLLGQLADVEHLIAVAAALPLGRAFLRLGKRRGASGAEVDRANELLTWHGGGSLSWMTTWPGHEYLIDPRGEGYLAYRQHAGVAVTVGDPVGSADWKARAMGEFAAHCDRSGLVPCGFSVGAGSVAAAESLRWKHAQVAEDTLISLGGLEFRGKQWQDVRTARNRAAKEGIEHRLITLADASPSVTAQVREVSAGWSRRKRMPELGFTLGGVTEAMDPRVRVGIAVDAAGTVHGVTSWLPILDATGRPKGWTLDMMRRRSGGFRLVIDFLIASACLEFQAEGAEVVSLSGAPLARSKNDDSASPRPIERLLDTLGAAMEPCYGFRSLHAYKSKFQPRREPLFLVYRRTADLPRIGVALLRAYLSGAWQRRAANRISTRVSTLPIRPEFALEKAVDAEPVMAEINAA